MPVKTFLSAVSDFAGVFLLPAGALVVAFADEDTVNAFAAAAILIGFMLAAAELFARRRHKVVPGNDELATLTADLAEATAASTLSLSLAFTTWGAVLPLLTDYYEQRSWYLHVFVLVAAAVAWGGWSRMNDGRKQAATLTRGASQVARLEREVDDERLSKLESKVESLDQKDLLPKTSEPSSASEPRADRTVVVGAIAGGAIAGALVAALRR